MSQGFRLKYDEMLDNGLSGKEASTEGTRNPQDTSYGHESHVRNINFILPGGDMIFLNYGYLVSCRCAVTGDKIILSFTTDKVILTGIYLKPLYYDLMSHLPRQIVAVDARYNVTAAKDTPIVNDISVKENG